MGNRIPKSRVDFWQNKLQQNRIRDIRNGRKLRRLGWKVLVMWECKLCSRDDESILRELTVFLEGKVEPRSALSQT